jgi:hypothetical protein
VIAPVSIIAARTSLVRACAAARSRRGENADGARVNVASIAACESVRSRADLPK